MKDNPWRGLSPYTEPKAGEKTFAFCGRSKATRELTSLIHNNLFVTLYGKTGIGKTSLLQAGVFPYLRSRQFTPITIRLGQLPKKENLAGYAISEIKNAIGEDYIQSYCQEIDLLNENCMWLYFSSTRFFDEKGQTIYPVLVFDQFEEIFLSRKDDAWFFMRQLYALLDDSLMANEEKGQHSETNFRIVVSIREDELFRLDDCIDSLSLSEMLSNRYRLAELRDEEAREVILIPGDGIIKETEQKELADQIIHFIKDKNGNQLNTLLLSLICSLLYDTAAKEWSNNIGVRHLYALGDNPLKEFYLSVAANFTRKQRTFIEERLVDINGRRNPVPINEFEHIFGDDKSFFTGDKHIFNTVSVTSDNTTMRVELVHDLIAQTIHEGKIQRYQQRTFFQRILLNGVFDSIVLAFDMFIILFLVITQNDILSYIGFIPYGIMLLLSTYFLNVTRIHNDYRVDAFLLPIFSTSTLIYVSATRMNLYAYHIIKPSMIEFFLVLFLWLNIILIIISICGRLSQYFNNQINLSNHLEWKSFFSIRLKENRFPQVSMTLGFIFAICVILFTPLTHYEKVRSLAKQGQPEAMVELGNYYLEYDINTDKAKEWYTKALSLGADVDDQIRKCDLHNSYQLTDSMKVEATRALLAQVGMSGLPQVVEIVDNGKIEPSSIINIIKYYEQLNEGSIVIRWKSVMSHLYDCNYGSLGYEFWRGEIVEQDMERAFELYLKGKSHMNVVICYSKGWGVERSPRKAQEYIEKENCSQSIPRNVLLGIEAQLKYEQLVNNMFNF